MSAKPATIDEYLDALPDDKRRALEKLRRSIHSMFPRAEECISYQLPAFRLDGRVVAWFGAAKNHCSFFPGGIDPAFKKDLKGYDVSKGTIRFQPDDPLPASLVRRLMNARIAKTSKPAGTRRSSKPAGRRRAAKGAKKGAKKKSARR
jgi:uncharacterized protein YdhG (YjbR/CyaY superfamily)